MRTVHQVLAHLAAADVAIPAMHMVWAIGGLCNWSMAAKHSTKASSRATAAMAFAVVLRTAVVSAGSTYSDRELFRVGNRLRAGHRRPPMRLHR